MESETPRPAKRPLSDVQKANLKKGMEALRAKREALRAEQEKEATEPVVEEKKPEPKAKAKPAPAPAPAPAPVEPPPVKEKKTYKKKSVSFDDFNNFKNELLTTLKPQTAPPTVIEKEKPVFTERVIEKVVEKPTVKYLSGSELLDKLFFNK